MRMFALLFLVACGSEADEPVDTGSCDVICQPSMASSSADSCQVNLFCTTTEPAVYCSDDGAGGWDCSCGAAVDNPPSFISPDLCDLDMDDAVCEALANCPNWVMD